jgi:hypothetical protein
MTGTPFAFAQIFPNYHVPVPALFSQASAGTDGDAGGNTSGLGLLGSEPSRTPGETFCFFHCGLRF